MSEQTQPKPSRSKPPQAEPPGPPPARPYRLQRRAEKQAATRLRIVEAAIKLHGTIGPGRTTMSAIAQLAGVQRNTLYSYFPDESAVGQACSSLWYERNPAPNINDLRAIPDPIDRLRATIQATHAYYAQTHQMLASLSRDMDLPYIQQAAAPLFQQAAERRDTVVQAFRLRGARRTQLRAAVELALDFETWRTLIQRCGLPPAHAVDLLTRMVTALAPDSTASNSTAPRSS